MHTDPHSCSDDYLVKPFSLAELKARVRALLRRSHQEANQPACASFGEIEVDLLRRRVRRLGREVALTAKVFGVLALLIQNAGQGVSREQFLDVVWGYAPSPPPAPWTITSHACARNSNRILRPRSF